MPIFGSPPPTSQNLVFNSNLVIPPPYKIVGNMQGDVDFTGTSGTLDLNGRNVDNIDTIGADNYRCQYTLTPSDDELKDALFDTPIWFDIPEGFVDSYPAYVDNDALWLTVPDGYLDGSEAKIVTRVECVDMPISGIWAFMIWLQKNEESPQLIYSFNSSEVKDAVWQTTLKSGDVFKIWASAYLNGESFRPLVTGLYLHGYKIRGVSTPTLVQVADSVVW